MDELELAGCILLNRQGEILLLHRNTEKYNHWEVPGGKVEQGETDANAAKRELKEELGVEVRLERKLGHASFSDGLTMHYHWFLATTTDTPHVCEPATFEVAYFSLEELSRSTLSLSEGAKCLVSQLKAGKITL